MNDWSVVLTAALPWLGVVDGAMLQYFFSRVTETTKQLELLRNQAYVDYLRAVAKAAHANSPSITHAALADAVDAKARIAVYGSERVTNALAKFEEAGPILDNPKSNDCFLVLASTMRPSGSQEPSDALRLVLLGQPRQKPDNVSKTDRISRS